MKKSIIFFFLILYIFISYQVAHAESMKAKVLNVDVVYNFMILDVGKKNNIFKGAKFEVFKNDEYLGETKVIKAKAKVAAFETESLKESVPIAPKDIIILKDIEKFPTQTVQKESREFEREEEMERALERRTAYEKPHREQKVSYRKPTPYQTGEKEYEDIRVYKKETRVPKKKKTPVVLRPFKKIKDWSVEAGREVKSWFTSEEEWDREVGKEEEIKLSSLPESEITEVPLRDSYTVKMETQIKASRRKVLFMINEELKNRGFIITNYSLIEGIIDAQKPLQLSTFKEIFANMKSAIDYRIIYTVDVRKIDEDFTHIDLDVSSSYKKEGEYRRMNVSNMEEVIQEAKEILIAVKERVR